MSKELMKIENQEVKKFVKVENEQYELQACGGR